MREMATQDDEGRDVRLTSFKPEYTHRSDLEQVVLREIQVEVTITPARRDTIAKNITLSYRPDKNGWVSFAHIINGGSDSTIDALGWAFISSVKLAEPAIVSWLDDHHPELELLHLWEELNNTETTDSFTTQAAEEPASP